MGMVDELRPVPIEVIYTSPCEPARSSAAAIGAELGLPVKEHEGLRNLNQGLWQGLCIEEIRRKHPKVFKLWQESPESICPPEGEMISDAMERVRKALEKPLKRGISFAIVASEPLATVIACHVSGRKLDLTHAVCTPDSGYHCEFLRTNGYQPNAAPVQPAVAVAPGNRLDERCASDS